MALAAQSASNRKVMQNLDAARSPIFSIRFLRARSSPAAVTSSLASSHSAAYPETDFFRYSRHNAGRLDCMRVTTNVGRLRKTP